MNVKKLKITDFIKSMEGDTLDTSTCLLGGATGNTAGVLSTTNGGDCINNNRESCNKSRNDGDCRNKSGYCNSSKNGGACNNAYDPGIAIGPVTNSTIAGCS